jgi:hypothetical protein
MDVSAHTSLAAADGGAGPRPPVSIYDVAAAGVSYQTVSRVINGSPRVLAARSALRSPATPP